MFDEAVIVLSFLRRLKPNRMFCLTVVLAMIRPQLYVLGGRDIRNNRIITDDNLEISDEKKLYKSLAANYSIVGKGGRPVVNMSQPTKVQFGLGLIQIDIDEKNKLLTSSMWARYRWNDEYLKWNAEDYGGVYTLRFTPDQVWKPDIMLYNTAETESSERKVMAVVTSDGMVLWVPHQIFKSSCSIDVTNFPFDSQTCSMWFGSWTYSAQEINLELAFEAGIDLSTFMSDYKESCAWDIVNTTAEVISIPEENPTYTVLSFSLTLRRKFVFSSYILTLPCIFLASLTLVVFWLPPDRPDRTSLAMSIFSSFLVLLLILVEAAPPTASSVPTLGIYYCFNMVIIMMSIFLSTLVVNVCRCGNDHRKVPSWVKKLTINCLGRPLCVVTSGHRSPWNHKDERRRSSAGWRDASITRNGFHKVAHFEYKLASALAQYDSCHNSNGQQQRFRSQSQAGENANGSSCEATPDSAQLYDLHDSVNDVISKINHRRNVEDLKWEIAEEWRQVARVMDRLFFLLYIILIVTSLVWLFPRPEPAEDSS